MNNFKITKNGKDLVTGLSKLGAIETLLPTVEEFSIGYIYDNEAQTIYHEVDGSVVAGKGDQSVMAGDNYFEIVTED